MISITQLTAFRIFFASTKYRPNIRGDVAWKRPRRLLRSGRGRSGRTALGRVGAPFSAGWERQNVRLGGPRLIGPTVTTATQRLV